jgi:hypothetical protein
MGKRIKRLEQLEIVHPNAGGLDIGAFEIWAAVPPDRDGETVKPFGTFTRGLTPLGRLAGEAWGRHGRDGEYRRILDPHF